jgi:hypothetical protein
MAEALFHYRDGDMRVHQAPPDGFRQCVLPDYGLLKNNKERSFVAQGMKWDAVIQEKFSRTISGENLDFVMYQARRDKVPNDVEWTARAAPLPSEPHTIVTARWTEWWEQSPKTSRERKRDAVAIRRTIRERQRQHRKAMRLIVWASRKLKVPFHIARLALRGEYHGSFWTGYLGNQPPGRQQGPPWLMKYFAQVDRMEDAQIRSVPR